MNIYCVYLTTYSGNKLPPFYIGSTSIKKIYSGYKGSVKSKKYRAIWEEELKINPHLFKTKIISVQFDRIECLKKEKFFQIRLNVVKSKLYINESIASPNGFFGRDISKENHPLFGKTPSEEVRRKISNSLKGRRLGEKNPFYGKNHTEKSKEKMRRVNLGKPSPLKGIAISEETKRKISNSKNGNCPKFLGEGHKKNISYALTGRSLSSEHLQNIKKASNNRPILTCEFCGKMIKGKSNLVQHQRGNRCQKDVGV